MHRVPVRRGSIAAVALFVWGAWTSGAEAQTPIMVVVRDFTGRTASQFSLMDLATVAANPITGGECDATITFRFTNVDVTRAQLEWFQGANCNDPAVRTSTTTTSCQALPVQSTAIDGRSQVDVAVRAGDLIDCESNSSGVRTVWVLALNNPNDTVTGNGQSVSFPIAFDLAGPSQPTGLMGTGGEDAAHLTWDTPTTAVDKYQIFMDPNGCTDGTVTSTGLTSTPPDESLIVSTISGTTNSADVAFPDSVPIPGEVAIAIRPEDRSGNKGELSNIICVERFAVTTWWDMYCGGASPPAACSSSGCAVEPGDDGGGPLGVLAALIVGLALVVRRRGR